MDSGSIAPPVPGIYPGVSHREYLRWDCASNSRLTDIRRSPAYCRHRIDTPTEPTPALVLGEAIHMFVLEPDRAARTYRLRPPGDGKKTAVRDARDQLIAEGFTLLTESDWDACHRIQVAFRRHPTLGACLDCAIFEVSAVAEVPDDRGRPVLCKVRADGLLQAVASILELKSAKDATPEGFSRAIHGWGYHRAAALYQDVFRTLHQPIDRFVFGAIMKDDPFEVAAYTLEDEAVEMGRRDYQTLLGIYQDCVEANAWPGLSEEVLQIGLPRWAYASEKDEWDE